VKDHADEHEPGSGDGANGCRRTSEHIAVTPDGKSAVVSGGLAALAVLDLSALSPGDKEADTEALRLRAELLAGQKLHEGGGTVNLSADEWLDCWHSFRQLLPAAEIVEPHVDPRAALGQSGGRAASAGCGAVAGQDRAVP
jgi:hypothetical protein